MPEIVTDAGPNGAAGATLTAKAAEAVPAEGTLIGLGEKLEKLIPGGALVTASVTGPEYPVIEVAVIVIPAELPWGMETEPGRALSPKSGVMDVILAILFAPDSITHVLPAESTITSCGCVFPNGYSVNCPFAAPVIGVVAGVTIVEDTVEGGGVIGVTVDGAPPEGAVVGAAETTVPPADGFSVDTWPLFACDDCSAIHGFCVNGLTLISLGSEPAVGTCHSLIVLSPRNTPT